MRSGSTVVVCACGAALGDGSVVGGALGWTHPASTETARTPSVNDRTGPYYHNGDVSG
jgi:hypothetical protein